MVDIPHLHCQNPAASCRSPYVWKATWCSILLLNDSLRIVSVFVCYVDILKLNYLCYKSLLVAFKDRPHYQKSELHCIVGITNYPDSILYPPKHWLDNIHIISFIIKLKHKGIRQSLCLIPRLTGIYLYLGRRTVQKSFLIRINIVKYFISVVYSTEYFHFSKLQVKF